MRRSLVVVPLIVVSCLIGAASARADESVVGAIPPTAPTTGISGSKQALQEPPAAVPAAPVRETTIFGLPKNMGPVDRILRGVIAGTLVGLGSYGFASHAFSPALSGALMGVAVIPGGTAATGYCPLYQVFGVDYSF